MYNFLFYIASQVEISQCKKLCFEIRSTFKVLTKTFDGAYHNIRVRLPNFVC